MLEQELQFAINIARVAGSKALQFIQASTAAGSSRISHTLKIDNSVVTEADKAVNEYIVSSLHTEYPNDAIVAEESSRAVQGVSSSRVWYVDPIDGTKEYIKGTKMWSVMIGLVLNGSPQLGVVYQAEADIMYSARAGAGAFRTDFNTGKTTRLQCTATPGNEVVCEKIQDARVVVSPDGGKQNAVKEIMHELGMTSTFPCSSFGLKVIRVAEGAADVFFHLDPGNVSYWDTCAPQAILQEAGGRVLDAMTGRNLEYPPVESTSHPSTVMTRMVAISRHDFIPPVIDVIQRRAQTLPARTSTK